MKRIKNLNLLFVAILSVFLFGNCSKPNDEFVHTKNTISQMLCKNIQATDGFRGDIYEFDKDGKLIEGNFTQEDVEGGYGLILFSIPKTFEDDVDLKNVFLVATLTYDEFVEPTLSGRHDITGDGIIITVKSGVGTTRQYRVRGYFE